jgi:hypothetical protein
VYQHQLGVGKLTADHLPAWPDEDSPWPTDPADSTRRLLRFKWDFPYENEDNWKGIRCVSDFIKKKGVSLLAGAAGPLRVISDDDLQNCVVRKFKDMQKSLRDAARKKTAAVPVHIDGDGTLDGESNGTGITRPVATVVKLSKAKKQSRQIGVRENSGP